MAEIRSCCIDNIMIASRIRTRSIAWRFHTRRQLLALSCMYLLSATGSITEEGATPDASSGYGKGDGYLRNLVVAAATSDDVGSDVRAERSSPDIAPPFDGGPGAAATASSSTSVEEEDEEEFDYETYHARHRIPVPALGATMMGMGYANSRRLQQRQQSSEDEEDMVFPAAPRGIFAFSGTSEAIRSFASALYYGDTIDGGNNLTFDDAEDEEIASPDEDVGSDGAMMYEATLAQITKSRSSLLYGPQASPPSDVIVGADPPERENPPRWKNEAAGSTQLEGRRPRLPKSDYDLDRGRHLVGLEVREISPHQRIIVDYQDSFEGQQPMLRPIRILYLVSNSINVEMSADGANNEASDGNTQLLSTHFDSSLNRTAAFLSRALSLPPVVGNIFPTVTSCGSAKIPDTHRERGVENADVVIYVTGDNKYCGGAVLHSAICDFDQNMRPLVANINICTRNIPTAIALDYGVPILNVDDYDSYISTETARILGASTSLLRHYSNPDTGIPYGSTERHVKCVDGSHDTISLPKIIGEVVDSNTGQFYYEIRTPNVIEVVRNHFGCMTMTGARLEAKRGTTGCFGGFLDEHLFFGEQLSGFQVVAKGQVTAISPLTLALLEDSSWYVANYTVSSEISFGRGAGCQFAHGTCEIDHNGAIEVNAHGKGYHCTEIDKMGCDITHTFKARCDGLFVGASSHQSDVCPMYIRGAIDCAHGTPDSPSTLPGEVYGESSKCFITDEGQPICLQGTCNEEKQGVDIRYDDEVFTCTQVGQIIDTQKGLRIECPRIAAICPDLICPSNCSARGVCDEDRDGKYTCICDDPFDDSLGCWGR